MEFERVRRGLAAGYTLKELGTYLGVTRYKVGGWLYRQGWDAEDRLGTLFDWEGKRDTAAFRLARGASAEDVAALIGAPVKVVTNWWDRLGKQRERDRTFQRQHRKFVRLTSGRSISDADPALRVDTSLATRVPTAPPASLTAMLMGDPAPGRTPWA